MQMYPNAHPMMMNYAKQQEIHTMSSLSLSMPTYPVDMQSVQSTAIQTGRVLQCHAHIPLCGPAVHHGLPIAALWGRRCTPYRPLHGVAGADLGGTHGRSVVSTQYTVLEILAIPRGTTW